MGDDDRARALLGFELELLGELHADSVQLEEVVELGLVVEVGAGGIAPRVARAPVLLAEETGGIAVVNQNDFDKALKRIDAESSDYYVLGFYSNNPDPTKRRRELGVKVVRPRLNVTSQRTEYVLKAPPRTSAQRP